MATTTSRRKIVVIALGSVLVVLLATFTALNAFSLKFLNPATTGQRVVFIGLSVLAFLVFVAVLLMLVRNVVKLYADQQSRVMGSRLRTRMMWGAILVSLIPLVFMFLFSYWLMNRAVDRWFSEPVTEMHDDSTRIADQLAQYTSANARVEAESICGFAGGDGRHLGGSPGRQQRVGPGGDRRRSAPARDHVAGWLCHCVSRGQSGCGVSPAAEYWRAGAGKAVAAAGAECAR